MIRLLFVLLLALGFSALQIKSSYSFAVLKYNGGGDWYANPTSVPNLVKFCNKELKSNINKSVATVAVGSSDIFNYPFIHMTGHGNVVFNSQERENIRKYLLGGGFLHIDDNYGMDAFVKAEIKKVFPEYKLIELPANHPIYHQKFKFPKGLPKIHEHDKKAPQGLAIIHEGRIVLYYTSESDLGDGWEDSSVHKDSSAKRQEALQMGANIVQYVLGGQLNKS
jgi:hypothetical protein